MLLIVAYSARMLAQQAKYAGLVCVAIDCFADCDTQASCNAVKQIKNLSLSEVQIAIDDLLPSYLIDACVYGSGLECYPETLQYLSQQFKLFGNSPDVFASALPHLQGFARWDQWKIPYPEVRFSAPCDSESWLVKPLFGNGGSAIIRYSDATRDRTSVFWQREMTGMVASVVFSADGLRFKIIGFNRQFSIMLGEYPFVFRGLLTWPHIDSMIRTQIFDWLSCLVPGLGLKGVNGLDFMIQSDGCYLLEINPRPPASLSLYGRQGWLWHQAGCSQREWPDTDPIIHFDGLRIVYAPQDVLIPQELVWPKEANDIPRSGVLIRKGQPICSIMSHQLTEAQVLDDLDRLEQSIFQLFL